MPKYDYRCLNCDNIIEIEKSMVSPHPTLCPDCGTDGLRRIFGTTAFSVRGDHLRIKHPKVTPPPGVEIQPRSS